MRERLVGWIAVVAMGAFVGCATERTTVTGADLGRLKASQLGPVDQAQAELGAAEQARAQAARQLEAAESALRVAEPGQMAAQASIDQAKAELSRAEQSGDPKLIDQAKQRRTIAQDYGREEEARTDFYVRDAAARRADLAAADRRVDLARAEVEKSRLEALREAHNPAANKYQGWRFDEAVSTRSEDLSGAMEAAKHARRRAREAFDQWQLAKNQYLRDQQIQPARGGPVAPPPLESPLPRRAQPAAPVGGPTPDAEPDQHE